MMKIENVLNALVEMAENCDYADAPKAVIKIGTSVYWLEYNDDDDAFVATKCSDGSFFNFSTFMPAQGAHFVEWYFKFEVSGVDSGMLKEDCGHASKKMQTTLCNAIEIIQKYEEKEIKE